MATVQSRPSASSGVRIARAVSLASARSGVIQSRRVRATGAALVRLSFRAQREICALGSPRFLASLGMTVGERGELRAACVFETRLSEVLETLAATARA